jgi:signal transduction histidine kinase
MQFEDDVDLATQYYRLRGRRIYYRYILDNCRRYGALAPVLAQFSSLCSAFVHDLGNGFNAILSKLERLSTEQADPAHQRAIGQAKAFCNSCGWRLYTLQEVSPSPPIHPEPADLPQWIPRVLGTLAVWQPPSVQVRFQTTESRLIVADYDNMLRLALLEPLLNAFQALLEGGQVAVSLQRCDDGLAQIEIADTGPGLPHGDPEGCFDLRFTTAPHHYGLGLYVARKVIEKHRGTFTLRSEPGQGTHAIIQLPIGNPEPDWDDESALTRELERLYDATTSQEQAIATCQANLSPSREQMLSQLSDLFGQLCASTVQLLESGLAGIRRLLTPLSGQLTGEAAEHVHFVLEKCDYQDIVLGNARALDPACSIRPVSVDLNQLLSQVVRLMTWRTEPDTQLHISQHIPLPVVQADVSLMATVLLNLLRNALDAAGRGGHVDVQTSFTKDAVLIHLTNTGDRIPLDAQTRIFDLDYTTRQGRAFGMGLYVARAIMARHDGFISVHHLPHSRVRFEIALPRHTGGTR